MSSKSVHYYLVKAARISGWLLLPLVLLYILTGFVLCDPEHGVERWVAGQVHKVVSSRTALAIHRIFEWPLIVVFLVHSLVTVYFALRRWGWIKTRGKPRSPGKPDKRPATGPSGPRGGGF